MFKRASGVVEKQSASRKFRGAAAVAAIASGTELLDRGACERYARILGSLARSRELALGHHSCRAGLRGESGANVLEMALVLPVYFLLVFTLISFAIVLFAYGNATYASKAAVRYAVVHGALSVTPCSATDLQNIVTPYLWGAPTGGVTITPQWSPSNAVGSTVSVTVQLTYSTGMPYGYLNNLVVSTTAEGIILH